MSSGVGRRHGSDLALLWLWPRPLVWGPPYTVGAALKRRKTNIYIYTHIYIYVHTHIYICIYNICNCQNEFHERVEENRFKKNRRGEKTLDEKNYRFQNSPQYKFFVAVIL